MYDNNDDDVQSVYVKPKGRDISRLLAGWLAGWLDTIIVNNEAFLVFGNGNDYGKLASLVLALISHVGGF